MDEATREVISKPDTMRNMYRHVANGGSIIDLCETWGARYSDVMFWVHNDAKRKSMYEDALQAQAEWAVRRVLKEVQTIGVMDIRQAYDDDGRLINPKDMSRETAAAIQSLESVEYFEGSGKDREQVGWVKKVKFWNKLDAIKMMMQNLGMLVERVEHSGRVTLEQLVEDSIKKEKKVDAEVVDEKKGSVS